MLILFMLKYSKITVCGRFQMYDAHYSAQTSLNQFSKVDNRWWRDYCPNIYTVPDVFFPWFATSAIILLKTPLGTRFISILRCVSLYCFIILFSYCKVNLTFRVISFLNPKLLIKNILKEWYFVTKIVLTYCEIKLF